MRSAVPSSGPRKRISSSQPTMDCPVAGHEQVEQGVHVAAEGLLGVRVGWSRTPGRMMPLEPPSGMSLFFLFCVKARL